MTSVNLNGTLASNLLLSPTISDCQDAWFSSAENGNATSSNMAEKWRHRNIYGIVFVALQMVLGVIGNSVVLFVYWRKYRRSNYRVYVLFLAFLDIGSCILTMPFVIIFLYKAADFPSDFICRAGLLVGFTLGVAQSGALVLIAFDRFRKICRPLKKQISVKQAKLSCIFIMIFALLCTWFTPFLYGTVNRSMGDMQITQCYLSNDNTPRFIAKAYYILLMVLFVLVTTLLCVLYFFIMRKVHSHSKSFYAVTKPQNGTHNVGRNRSLKTRKTTMTFFIITAVYVVCTIPHDALGLVFHIIEDLECKLSYTAGSVFFFFYWTVFLNNIANPLIYGLSDDRFTNVLKNYISKFKGHQTVSVKESISENSRKISNVSNFENPVANSISSFNCSKNISYSPNPTSSAT
ncbi:hypothetical protein FSP39_003723 [Pinctada imbricata]|uniref:G-protein coupled receptors family 1 profile domain-containing protein n=1 Tax=Pinctada imbricata TaxID=66713 RepID=A0AA88XH38_PINIB|nr:hypothetical protein FSP39_003723 [Pinctada imbricata]